MANLAVRASLSAAQQVAPLVQVATIDSHAAGPTRHLSAAQVLAPIGQTARLVRLPFHGPAVPRPG